ncbi:pheromone A receptor-domain-containing protein [Mariannaea sp. PMI_226]|nr:pheromone A receptor-domain-containing protein [Mariannaea sp. PMI_226]
MTSSTSLLARDGGSFIYVLPGGENANSTSLMVNLIMRVVLSLIANFICVVPLKHLYHGSEFAAVVFIANLMVVNLQVIINALIWRNDNTDNWWPGYGMCDLNPYLHNISVSLYVTCLLAIIRNLAHQVGLLRANPLTVKEKRRRNLVQALIMFPLPIIQLAWIWPLTSQRYVVATLVGCAWSAWPSWPYIFLFCAAPVFIAIITAGYAILVFIRFREVARTTQSALSSNRVVSLRAQRTRRRLYLMVISILVPFVPIVITLAVLNVRAASPLLPFDYDEIHKHVLPVPWNTIIYFPSGKQEFAFLNNCYISILSSIPVFVFFGMTKNAMNDYRRTCLWFGLGHLFPILYEEYDPDRDAYGSSHLSSNVTNSTTRYVPFLPVLTWPLS